MQFKAECVELSAAKEGLGSQRQKIRTACPKTTLIPEEIFGQVFFEKVKLASQIIAEGFKFLLRYAS